VAAFVLLSFATIPAQAAPAPATGACCSILGCCGPVSGLAQPDGGVGVGSCSETTSALCDFAHVYQGDGTTCLGLCPTTTTSTTSTTITTSTTLPSGACCESNGDCLDLYQVNCNDGVYQGDGSQCSSVVCPTTTTTVVVTTTMEVTTTTQPVTTTTILEVSICGDANSDGDITAGDALIALKTAVGSAQCIKPRCDYNGDDLLSSSDALAILKVSVGQIVIPMCPLL
jgi:hypothetical protein